MNISNKLKILFIGIINENDGSGKRLIPLLSHINSEGHLLEMIVHTDSYNYLHRYLIGKNIKIYILDGKGTKIITRVDVLKHMAKEFIISLKLLFLMRNVLKNFDADLVYISYSNIFGRGMCVFCSKLFRKMSVLEFNDFSGQWGLNINGFNGKMKITTIYHIINNFCLDTFLPKKVDSIIATPFIKKYCVNNLKIDQNKVDVIPCGADPNFFNKNMDYSDVIRKYGLKGFNVITYTGALYKAFGISDLIDAMYLVIKKHKNTKLVLVGRYIKRDMQEFTDKVEKYGIKDNVIFVELQPYSEIPKFINASDICVNPFPGSPICRAGSPVKVFEYMLCGKPVVHSDLECVEDVIIDGKSGLLYEADNIQDLADKINILIESPELRKQLGDAAEKLILEKYTWDKLGNQLIDSFTTINDTNNT